MADIIIPEDTIYGTVPPSEAAKIPSWSTGADWNTVELGGVTIPGVCTIKGLKLGVEVETKKPKGSDQPTSKDLGLDPSKFEIEVRLAEWQWPAFQTSLPLWNPRRPGRARAPVSIVHPWPNNWGIKMVRVIAVEGDQPTARSGALLSIKVEEWFDAPVETKNSKPKKSPPIRSGLDSEMRQAYINDARALGVNSDVARSYPDDVKKSVRPSEISFGIFNK